MWTHHLESKEKHRHSYPMLGLFVNCSWLPSILFLFCFLWLTSYFEILICWHHFNSIPKVTKSWKHLIFWAKYPSLQFTAHLFLPSQSVELNLLNGVHQTFTAMFRNNDVTWWAHLKKSYRFKKLRTRSHPSCRHASALWKRLQQTNKNLPAKYTNEGRNVTRNFKCEVGEQKNWTSQIQILRKHLEDLWMRRML